MFLTARHYRTAQPYHFTIENGRYQAIEPVVTEATDLLWIAPGLCDHQINGFGGVDFNRLPTDPEAWDHACQTLARHGCTHFLTTFITHPAEEENALLSAWETLRQQRPWNCVGYHCEGPFLNPESGYHGAHEPEWMRAPNLSWWEEKKQILHDHLRLITLAPETNPEQAHSFITTLHAQNVRLAAGHSALQGALLETMMEAGLSSWTHLGNAAPAIAPKFDNVIFHVLAQEKLRAALIPDGLHVPPHAFRVIARALGPRLLLTTDAMAGAGAAVGTYTLGHRQVDVRSDGSACLRGSTTLAGSTLTPFQGVFHAATLSGLPWSECWDAFSLRPAQWLGLPPHDLGIGQEASFCLFDLSPRLHATYLRGEKVA